MFEDFKLILEILTKPGDFFNRIDEQPIGELYKFWIQLSLLNTIIGFILSLLNISGWSSIVNKLSVIIGSIFPLMPISGVFLFNIIFSIILFIFMITFGFIFTIITSFFIHIFVYILGGRGFKKTLTIFVIASTPTMILGPVPIISRLGSLYGFILQILGLSKLHKFSILRAVAVILIPIIIIGLIIGALIIGSVYFYGSQILTKTSHTLSIVSGSCSNGIITIVLANDGKKDIDTLTDIEVLVNGNKIENYSFNPAIIPPGSTAITTISDHNIKSGMNRVEIISPSNSDTTVVYC